MHHTSTKTRLKDGRYRIIQPMHNSALYQRYAGLDRARRQPVWIEEFRPRPLAEQAIKNHQRVATTGLEALFSRYAQNCLAESRRLLKFDHAHMVRVIDCFPDHGTVFRILEPVSGKNLHSWLEEQRQLNQRPADNLIEQGVAGLAAAVTALHRLGLQHLDIRANNIVITATSEMLLLAVSGSLKHLVRTGSIHTVTPFQDQLKSPNSGCSYDRFSLGLLLLEMLTGIDPHTLHDRQELAETLQKARLAERWRFLIESSLGPMAESANVMEWWSAPYQNDGAQQIDGSMEAETVMEAMYYWSALFEPLQWTPKPDFGKLLIGFEDDFVDKVFELGKINTKWERSLERRIGKLAYSLARFSTTAYLRTRPFGFLQYLIFPQLSVLLWVSLWGILPLYILYTFGPNILATLRTGYEIGLSWKQITGYARDPLWTVWAYNLLAKYESFFLKASAACIILLYGSLLFAIQSALHQFRKSVSTAQV